MEDCEYEIVAKLKIGSILKSVADVEETINKGLSEAGEGTMRVTKEFAMGILPTTAPLDDEEIERLEGHFLKVCMESEDLKDVVSSVALRRITE